MKKVLFVLGLFILFMDVVAQDPSFTQFNSAPLWYNPAFAGSIKEKRISALYRNQWPALEGGGYQTAYVSYDQYVKLLRGGVGFMSLYDQAGSILKTYTNSLVYAPKIKLSEKISISPAFKFSFCHKSIDVSALTFGDMIDPRYGFVNTTAETVKEATSFFDLTTGIVLNTNSFYTGLNVEHLLEPNQGFIGESPLPRRYSIVTGYTYQLKNEKFSITPTVLFQKQQDFYMLMSNVSFRYKWLLLGAGYRFGDAILTMAGVEIGNLRVNYSYDITVSKLTNATGGAHEVSVRYLIK